MRKNNKQISWKVSNPENKVSGQNILCLQCLQHFIQCLSWLLFFFNVLFWKYTVGLLGWKSNCLISSPYCCLPPYSCLLVRSTFLFVSHYYPDGAGRLWLTLSKSFDFPFLPPSKCSSCRWDVTRRNNQDCECLNAAKKGPALFSLPMVDGTFNWYLQCCTLPKVSQAV